MNPEWADDPSYVDWFVWTHRLSSSPESYVEFRRMTLDTDLQRRPRPANSRPDARPRLRSECANRPRTSRVSSRRRAWWTTPAQGASLQENDAWGCLLRSSRSCATRRRLDVLRARRSRPFSSPTSSARRSSRPSSATAAGAGCSTRTSRWSGGSRRGSAAASSIRWRRVLRHLRRPGPRDRLRRAILDSDARARARDPRGIHTGECERGARTSRAPVHSPPDPGGGGTGEVLVSGTLRDLVVGSASPSTTSASTSSRACPARGGCCGW